MFLPEVPAVQARANWSRWIVNCPLCPSALTVHPGTERFDCPDCGIRTAIVWPSEEMVAGIERLLSMRPDPSTRNWEPGETLIDLMVENGANGVFTPELAAIPHRPGDSLFQTTEDRIVTDRLPALPQRIRVELDA